VVVGTFDGPVADIAVLGTGTAAGVVMAGRNGRLTLFGITDGAQPRPVTIGLGVPATSMMCHDRTLLVGTGAGVAALELPDLHPYRPPPGDEDALGSAPTDWASVLDDVAPLDSDAEDGSRPPDPTWPAWVALVVCVGVAAAAAGLTWLLPAWLYLAYVEWSDLYAEFSLESTWSRRWAIAGTLLAAAAALTHDRGPFVRAAIAAPTALVVTAWLARERYGPNGHELHKPRSPLTSAPASWRAMANAFRFPRLYATRAEDRAWLGGFLAMFLAAHGWDALLAGAALPVTAGTVGLVLLHLTYRWSPMLHQRAVLLLGFLVGIVVAILT